MINLKKLKKKAEIELDVMGWWILGLVIFVVIVFAIIILTSKGQGALDYIKNIFRFR